MLSGKGMSLDVDARHIKRGKLNIQWQGISEDRRGDGKWTTADMIYSLEYDHMKSNTINIISLSVCHIHSTVQLSVLLTM